MGLLDFIPVVGDVVDAVVGGINMGSQAHYQRRNMREAAQLQHDENVFWANYNTPQNQMKRLQEAGLNPHLVYGDGATATAGGSVHPSGGMPTSQKSNFGNLGLAIEQAKYMRSQQGVNASIQQKNAADADLAAAQAEKVRAETPYIPESLQSQSAKNRADVQLVAAQAAYLEAQEQYHRVETDIKRVFGSELAAAELKSHEIQNSIAELERNNLPRQLQAQYNLTTNQAKEVLALCGLYNAQVEHISEQIRNLQKQRDLFDKQGKLIDAQKNAQGVLKSVYGMNIITSKLNNRIREYHLPADIMNSYLSPANIVTGALGTMGINIKGLVSLSGANQVRSINYGNSLQNVNPFESDYNDFINR